MFGSKKERVIGGFSLYPGKDQFAEAVHKVHKLYTLPMLKKELVIPRTWFYSKNADGSMSISLLEDNTTLHYYLFTGDDRICQDRNAKYVYLYWVTSADRKCPFDYSFFSDLLKRTEKQKFEKTGAFTVAFGTADTVTISDYFGMATGHKESKIEKAGVHVHPSAHVNAPIIEEYPLTLECTVKKWDPEAELLIGKIVAMQADAKILTDGKVDLDKLKPIIFDASMHYYRVVGEKVGQAFHDGLALK